MHKWEQIPYKICRSTSLSDRTYNILNFRVTKDMYVGGKQEQNTQVINYHDM